MHFHIPKKRFGQHFLHDKTIIQKIIHLIHPMPNDHIVEIGPGQGALTVPLLQHLKELTVIELDRDLIPALKLRCEGKGNLMIHQGDILEFDLNILTNKPNSLRIVGNLPYNISTPLIFHLLNYAHLIRDMHFMLQKEVVARLAAKPHSEHYGRLSIMMQYHCDVHALLEVPPAAFYPPPEVDSGVVRLVPHQEVIYQAKNYLHFANLVRTAFSKRRKTLRNSLKEMMSDEDWTAIQMDSRLRPEDIPVQDFLKISNHMVSKL